MDDATEKQMMSAFAAMLGRKNKGRKKVCSPEESQRRRESLEKARLKRWQAKPTQNPTGEEPGQGAGG